MNELFMLATRDSVAGFIKNVQLLCQKFIGFNCYSTNTKSKTKIVR